MTTHKDLKKQLLENDELAKAYQDPEIATIIGDMIWECRLSRGITQTELASRCGTTQSSIARMENGEQIPTLKTLKKIAEDGFNARLVYPKINLGGTTLTTSIFNFAGKVTETISGIVNSRGGFSIYKDYFET